MRHRENFYVIAGLAFLLTSMSFCSLQTYGPPLPAPNQTQKAGYIHSLNNLYPRTFSAVQRIVLQVRRRQYDFLGHLAKSQKAVFRVTALGDMGGKLFDLYAAEGSVEVIENPMNMPEKPLITGVVGDIRHIFDIEIKNEAYLVQGEKGIVAVVSPFGIDQFHQYIFRADGRGITSSRTVIKGILVREVEYGEYMDFEGFAFPLPKMIQVKNFRWRYELEIELLNISPEVKKNLKLKLSDCNY